MHPSVHCSMCVCLVTELCLILCDPRDCSPPSSSVHGIFQSRMLEWVAISFSRGFSQPRDQTRISCVSCIDRQILYHCITGSQQHYLPIAKPWKQPKCASTEGWIKKMWYTHTHTTAYYLAIKNEIMSFVATWMDL